MSSLAHYNQHISSTINLSRFNAINADHERETLSNKYRFIPTTRVVNVLENMGWFPVKASEMKIRNTDRDGFQKHMICFRQHSDNSLVVKDTVFPEIVLTNSHDGLASFNLMAGLFRLVCENGLIIADSMFSTHSIRHMGYADQQVIEAVEAVADSVPRISNRVNEFQDIELTQDEQGVYAMAALEAKYGREELQKKDIDVNRMLVPFRYEDKTNSLWHTFNTVQEKLIKGGKYAIKTPYAHHPNYKRPAKMRGINSISESIRVNQALWTLTEKMAELKGGI